MRTVCRSARFVVAAATAATAFAAGVSVQPVPAGADTPLKVYVVESDVAEGDSSTTTLIMPIVLNHAATYPVSVGYRTKSGTARSALGDYTGVAGRVTFQAGVTSQSVRIPVHGDTKLEDDERLVLLLEAPSSGLELGHAGATGWILSDDTCEPCWGPDGPPT